MQKLTTDQFINKAIKIHGLKYIYDLVVYINNRTKVKLICNIHGVFEQIPNSHLLGKGCAQCSQNVKLTTQQFIEKSSVINNNFYDYTPSKYIANNIKLTINCPIHGLFEQLPSHHLNGHGCNKCHIDNKKLNLNDFINRSNIIHNNKYNYELVNYINSYSKIPIICKVHGIFKQSPNSHLAGQNCPKCAINYNKGLDKFIIEAIIIHKGKYIYSKSKYINNKVKLIIICLYHGEFLQIPNAHLSGQGCPNCNHIISEPEKEWLDSFNITLENRNIRLPGLGQKRVDGYDATTNTVYEFYGDYWHGNPIKFKSDDINKSTSCTFGQLYKQTIDKEKLIKNNGYNLVTIWENNYKEIK